MASPRNEQINRLNENLKHQDRAWLLDTVGIQGNRYSRVRA
jgi:hypothetical protein